MAAAPTLSHFCDLAVELGPPRELGEGRAGRRRIVPIIGGSVRGENLSGKILDTGADWQTIFADGVVELDARYAFETTDGAIIEIINYGFRHGPSDVLAKLSAGVDVPAASYYMRTQARLETGHPDYSWVNRMLFVGTGARHASAVDISLFVIR
jgi:hypothetical protein